MRFFFIKKYEKKENFLMVTMIVLENFSPPSPESREKKLSFRSKNIILMSSTSIPRDKSVEWEMSKERHTRLIFFRVGPGDMGHET